MICIVSFVLCAVLGVSIKQLFRKLRADVFSVSSSADSRLFRCKKITITVRAHRLR